MTFTSPTSSLTPSQVVNAFIENDTKIESIEVVKNYVEQFDSTKTQLLEEINLLLKEMKTAQSQLSSAKPQEYKDFLVLQGIKEYHGTDNDTAQQMLDWCSRRRESLGDALKEFWNNDDFFSSKDKVEFAQSSDSDRSSWIFQVLEEHLMDGYEYLFDYQCGFLSGQGYSGVSEEHNMKDSSALYLSQYFEDFITIPSLPEERNTSF
tara:strand:- start:464 stop:1084 length:621 start_codon:yes stop_codon:yes gene_type:complete